jgi:hypothetical protein
MVVSFLYIRKKLVLSAIADLEKEKKRKKSQSKSYSHLPRRGW